MLGSVISACDALCSGGTFDCDDCDGFDNSVEKLRELELLENSERICDIVARLSKVLLDRGRDETVRDYCYQALCILVRRESINLIIAQNRKDVIEALVTDLEKTTELNSVGVLAFLAWHNAVAHIIARPDVIMVLKNRLEKAASSPNCVRLLAKLTDHEDVVNKMVEEIPGIARLVQLLASTYLARFNGTASLSYYDDALVGFVRHQSMVLAIARNKDVDKSVIIGALRHIQERAGYCKATNPGCSTQDPIINTCGEAISNLLSMERSVESSAAHSRTSPPETTNSGTKTDTVESDPYATTRGNAPLLGGSADSNNKCCPVM